jgi:hypothetical protein
MAYIDESTLGAQCSNAASWSLEVMLKVGPNQRSMGRTNPARGNPSKALV